MKFPKPAAIFILLALNASAQWHDSAPFVAWPATNHLRWVDNVGVYTNVSNWQTNGYGAWTNNFILTNGWHFQDDVWFMRGYYSPAFFEHAFGSSVATNITLNAKDVRSFDCVMALMERHLVLSSGNTVSNFLDDPMYSERWFYRSERENIEWFKQWTLDHLSSFYYTTNNWTNAVQFTESNLCSFASVPTNFLRYTPHRAADMSFTVTNGYIRILTNTFVLCQGTNAAHYATNSLTDSAGIDFIVMGTNGTVITRYATNTSLQAGYNLPSYGWDGLRRVITSLVATASSVTWTNNGEINGQFGRGTNSLPQYSDLAPAVTAAHNSAEAAYEGTSTNYASETDAPLGWVAHAFFQDWSHYPPDVFDCIEATHGVIKSYPKSTAYIPEGYSRSAYFLALIGTVYNQPSTFYGYGITQTNNEWAVVGSVTNSTNSAIMATSSFPASFPASMPVVDFRVPDAGGASWPWTPFAQQQHTGWRVRDTLCVNVWDFKFK